MERAICGFVEALRLRLDKGVFTTEDSVRYTFFTTLMNELNVQPYEVILENLHPSIERIKVDTYIPSTTNRKGLVSEFKYDREIPSGKNAPRPHKAGKVFADIYRLFQFDTDSNTVKWLVY
ncbi:MAG TPA: hypothetical protein VJ824_06075, partial [Bacillota bacterium]|nr:hypothetical protein [Bacillota bacterium]